MSDRLNRITPCPRCDQIKAQGHRGDVYVIRCLVCGHCAVGATVEDVQTAWQVTTDEAMPTLGEVDVVVYPAGR